MKLTLVKQQVFLFLQEVYVENCVETENYLQLSSFIDEQILWLEISMQYTSGMTIG